MEAREQEFELKDGRKIFKTHNGFKYFLESKKGEVMEVTESYYLKALRNNAKK